MGFARPSGFYRRIPGHQTLSIGCPVHDTRAYSRSGNSTPLETQASEPSCSGESSRADADIAGQSTGSKHECNRKTRTEYISTPEKPYRYVDSNNVYLVGVRCFVCECGEIIAEIPAVRQLLSLIARDLVEKTKAFSSRGNSFFAKATWQETSRFRMRNRSPYGDAFAL